ncbi:MAG TPA: SH3 domain-containing protein [Myxococcota bacterium]|nr:SH3 domain-containing protein [Myxococcota bacterium]HRV18642.1 SH3 domain-containing protein [Myxococcota bacterium]
MSKNLYAMHDPGNWEDMVRAAGREAWCVHTEAIGCDPGDMSGKNFARPNITPVVRLNNGYGSTGTIPLPERYADFAKRCANFAAASVGCKHWIIGNEIALIWERPDGQPITLENYCRCFTLCRDAIRRVQPEAIVIPQPPAPWNVEVKYPGNEAGDWVDQLRDMLRMIGAGNLDAIALHTYSHGHDPALIASEQTMDPPFNHRRYHFRAYRDFMDAIPTELRHLDVLITESNPDGWQDINNGWIQAAYAEIDQWNKAGNQQIVCLAFYRWPNEDREQFWIGSKGGVVADFQAALAHDYHHYENLAPAMVANATKLRALDILNLRATPGTVNKDQWDVIGALKAGEVAALLGPHTDKDGIQWSQIRTDDGKVGWVATVLSDQSHTAEVF